VSAAPAGRVLRPGCGQLRLRVYDVLCVQESRTAVLTGYLAHPSQLDNYCPDDGELEKEKYIVDGAGNLQLVDPSELRREVSSARHQRLQAMNER
jgi:hypothetical protein